LFIRTRYPKLNKITNIENNYKSQYNNIVMVKFKTAMAVQRAVVTAFPKPIVKHLMLWFYLVQCDKNGKLLYSQQNMEKNNGKNSKEKKQGERSSQRMQKRNKPSQQNSRKNRTTDTFSPFKKDKEKQPAEPKRSKKIKEKKK
jgi:hypothetical protein